jgi:hypothetical protein
MLRRDSSNGFLPAPFGIALCGLLFCLWNLWTLDSAPCLSAGCEIFQNFSLAGVSLWWPGVFAFGILIVCGGAGRLTAGLMFSSLCLALDCLLLALMLVSVTCLACLGAGLLFALVYASFLRAAVHRRRLFNRWPFLSPLLGLWLCLFVANGGTLVRNSLEDWPIYAASARTPTPVRAFFSPSCPACRHLIQSISPEYAARIAWFPVAEEERDVRVLGAMRQLLAQGASLADAFGKALEEPLAGEWILLRPDMLLMQLRLWRNHSHVMENGNTLPLLEFSGTPSFLLHRNPDRAETLPPQSSQLPENAPAPPIRGGPQADENFDMPLDLDIAGSCGPQASNPCP